MPANREFVYMRFLTEMNTGNFKIKFNSKKNKFISSDFVKKIRSFLLSDIYMTSLGAFALLLIFFNLQVYAVLVLAGITAITMIFCDDYIYTLYPFLLICMISSMCYNSYSVFIKFWFIGVLVILCILMHYILYFKKPVSQGKLTISQLMVSIAVSLGGIGFIPKKDYFSIDSLFYVLALGFGMLILYHFMLTYLSAEKNYDLKDRLTNIMIFFGIFVSSVIAITYLKSAKELMNNLSIVYFQWRNNASSYLMLSIPFAFYLGKKKTRNIILGYIFFFVILLTGSRGGLIFGAVEIAICTLFFFFADKKSRVAYIALWGILIISMILFSKKFIELFSSTFSRLMNAVNAILTGETKEIRLSQYTRGLMDFFNHPLFGTGIGYKGNGDVWTGAKGAMNWYHCSVIQIAGSFGFLGIIAYVYQFVDRTFLIFYKNKSKFNTTVFLSYISLEMMSLVNPGVFAPIPYLLIIIFFFASIEKLKEKEQHKLL